jgi:hypothetical protein
MDSPESKALVTLCAGLCQALGEERAWKLADFLADAADIPGSDLQWSDLVWNMVMATEPSDQGGAA